MFCVGICGTCLEKYIFDGRTGVKLTSDEQAFHRCGISIEDNGVSKSFLTLAKIIYNLSLELHRTKEEMK